MNQVKPIYCVYLTTYSGDHLPPLYIGSTSLRRIKTGYKGSVKSKKYAATWARETKLNPHLFSVKVLSEHQSRLEALEAELSLHISEDVVKSKKYINESLASPNGFFGRDVAGKNHPLFGTKRSDMTRAKIKANHADAAGANNGRARTMRLTSPSGEVFDIVGELRKFCIERKLPYCTMNWILTGREFTRGACVGWKAIYL